MDGGSYRVCVGGVDDSSFDPAACCQKLPEIEETVGHNWLWQLGHDQSPWMEHLKANLHVTLSN